MYTTTALVANAARNIEIASGKTATMREDQANQFITEVEAIINSRLSAFYYTPLREIVRAGATKYPDPIQFIATRLAAALMVRSIYSRIDPVASENADKHYQDAEKELNDVCNGILAGSRRLEGQTQRSRNSFVNPYVAPLDLPKREGF